MVEQKGAGQPGLVSQLLKDLRKMDHHDKIVIRTDQEASIVDLFKRVAKDRGTSKTILETAPRSDSKANGEAENAVQSIEQMLRTYMVDLQERCGEELSVDDTLYAWLVEHACDMMNKFMVRKGGKTAWGRLKSGPFKGEVYPLERQFFTELPARPKGGSCKRDGMTESGWDCISLPANTLSVSPMESW